MNNDELLKLVVQTLFDKKGKNTLTLDVRGLSTLTNYLVIAEGNVDRHVKALAEAVVKAGKEHNLIPLHTEGRETGDWAVIDYGEVIIHLFMPGLREKYSLENLWREGTIVEVPVAVAPETGNPTP